MHLKAVSPFCLAPLLLKTCLGAPANNFTEPVSHVASETDVIALPDAWARYDLEVFENNATALEKRTPGQICAAAGLIASSCVATTFLFTYLGGLSAEIKEIASDGDCGEHHGFYGDHGEVKWVYHSTKSCTTTATRKTLEGAIKHHFEVHNDAGKLCETECLNLSHGSDDFEGYLKIGPSDGFDDGKYCGPELDFGKCTKGGETNV